MAKKEEIIDAVIVDGQAIDIKRTYTPAEYFEKIKSMKEKVDDEQMQKVLDLATSQMNKFKLLKQTEAASICGKYITMFEKEIKVIQAGFDTYVLKKDIEDYMKNLSEKCVFCTELEDYPRNIPDEIAERIAPHLELFDHIYIIFTDYTQKVSKHVDKKTREKDPIMFGAFNIIKGSRPVVGPRFYYIGDWVDEYCDLTLEMMLGKLGNEALHTLSIPENTQELSTNGYEYDKEVNNNSDSDIVTVKK